MAERLLPGASLPPGTPTTPCRGRRDVESMAAGGGPCAPEHLGVEFDNVGGG
ncbi:MAG: hypothetical protein R3F43_08505 [bacterium]